MDVLQKHYDLPVIETVEIQVVFLSMAVRNEVCCERRVRGVILPLPRARLVSREGGCGCAWAVGGDISKQQ